MTARNYKDQDEVGGLTKEIIQSMDDPHAFNPTTVLARAALLLWTARDEARETCAAQDAAAQKAQGYLLEVALANRKLREALDSVGKHLELGNMSEAEIEVREALALPKTQAEKQAGALLKRQEKLDEVVKAARLLSKYDAGPALLKRALEELDDHDKACREAGVK